MSTRRRFDHTGSSFDSFLDEQGLLRDAEAVAIKRVIAWQLKKAMDAKHVSKKQMADALQTSRSQVDRLLDPMHVGVSIGTVAKAARAVGKRVRFDIVDERQGPRRKHTPSRHGHKPARATALAAGL